MELNDRIPSLSLMSADECASVAAGLAQRARDLRAAEPSIGLALAAGVRDTSYRTVRYGLVDDYTGEGIVTMADGRRWRCVGRRARGTAETISAQGKIEFFPLDAG